MCKEKDYEVTLDVAIFNCRKEIVDSITTVDNAKEEHCLFNPHVRKQIKLKLSIKGVMIKVELLKNNSISVDSKIFILNQRNGNEKELTNETKDLKKILNEVDGEGLVIIAYNSYK